MLYVLQMEKCCVTVSHQTLGKLIQKEASYSQTADVHIAIDISRRGCQPQNWSYFNICYFNTYWWKDEDSVQWILDWSVGISDRTGNFSNWVRHLGDLTLWLTYHYLIDYVPCLIIVLTERDWKRNVNTLCFELLSPSEYLRRAGRRNEAGGRGGH